jgi:hypothetical protein
MSRGIWTKPDGTTAGSTATALLLCIALGTWTTVATAEAHCVATAAELEAALTAAETNATIDYILLERGTYAGNFSFGSYEHHQLTLRGGYDPGCGDRIDDPRATILDAGGSGTVLSLYQHAGGGVHVEGLTVRNGGYHGIWIRITNDYGDPSIDEIHLVDTFVEDCRTKSGVYMMSDPGDSAFPGSILIHDNVITGNSGERSGLTISASWSLPGGFVSLRNNVITGNIGTLTPGGLVITNYDTGTIYLTNNTIADNQTQSASPSVTGGADLSVGTELHAYNNVFWGNTNSSGPADLDVLYYGSAVGSGFNNVYGGMNGSWHASGGNLNVDPGFVSRGFWQAGDAPTGLRDDVWVDGDYHLGADSPCIDTGSDAAPGAGSLPPEDFEGDPRVVDGDGDHDAAVDIGADERTVIFTDGFESGNLSGWSGSTP